MEEERWKQAGFADAAAYGSWGALHRRHVLGEPMSAAEAADYEAGCNQLDGLVNYEGDIPRRQEVLERLQAVEEWQRRLREQERQASARIAALESQIAELTRQRTAVGN